MEVIKRFLRMKRTSSWYYVNLIHDRIGNKTFISLLEKDLVIQSGINDENLKDLEPFNIIPCNTPLIEDIAKYGNDYIKIMNSYKSSYITIFKMIGIKKLNKNDFFYKILMDLIENKDIDYIIIPINMIIHMDFSNLPISEKLISYIDTPNKSFLQKSKKHKFFKKQIEIVNEYTLANVYSSNRYFYVIR